MYKRQNLLLKANRLLGSSLVNSNLIGLNDLETANQSFLKKLQAGEGNDLSLLKIILYDLQSLKEENLIIYQIDEIGLGYLRLSNYNIAQKSPEAFQLEYCWSTWTLPFDHVDGFWLAATSYYLSPAVKKYWEYVLGESVIWYVSELSEIDNALETLSRELERSEVIERPAKIAV